MKKRKRQIVLQLILIVGFSVFYFYANGLYFSPEDVFYACERGLRGDISEEIVLEHKLDNGDLMLVGKQKDGLFVMSVERTHLFLWRMGDGYSGFSPCDKPLNGNLTLDENYLGFCQDETITEMSILVGNFEDEQWEEEVYPVEKGLIFIERDAEKPDQAGGEHDFVAYTEGRNAKGEVVFKDGEEGWMEAIRKGNWRVGERERVTKPFITAPAAKAAE